MTDPRRSMCAAILCLEAITLGLTTPVMITIAGVDPATAMTLGVGLMLLCLVTAGLLRRPWGYGVGYAIQVAAVGLGFLVPLMFFLGAVFAALWATGDWLGRKIERERAAAYAAHEQAGGHADDGGSTPAG